MDTTNADDDKSTASNNRLTDDTVATDARQLALEHINQEFLEFEAHDEPVGDDLRAFQTLAGNLRLKGRPTEWIDSDVSVNLEEVA